jgi:hypothetical protein
MPNDRRSGGPRTAAGKKIASRNAIRHGFAALKHRKPAASHEIERLAHAICGDEKDPRLYIQATNIAENILVLRSLRNYKLSVIERLRIPTARAFAKGDNGLKLARDRSNRARLALQTLEVTVPLLLAKYEVADTDQRASRLPGELVPLGLKLLMREPDSIEEYPEFFEQARKELASRDEHQAVVEAVLDLSRLDRYERRTSSNQKKAIREFTDLKLIVSHQSGRVD